MSPSQTATPKHGGHALGTAVSDNTAQSDSDGRDVTGFVDGTANPPIRRAGEVALVPPGEPGEGGRHASRCAGCTISPPSTSSRARSRNA